MTNHLLTLAKATMALARVSRWLRTILGNEVHHLIMAVLSNADYFSITFSVLTLPSMKCERLIYIPFSGLFTFLPFGSKNSNPVME